MRESLNRLSPALVSTDLSLNNEVRRDADFVAALGMASRVYPIASPLIRLYLTHDKASVVEARRHAFEMARKAAVRKGYRLNTHELVTIGRQSLDYAINKTCPRCHGTKFEIIPGTTCLGTNVCKSCNGDGRRALPKKNRAIIVEVVARIERIESNLDTIVSMRV